MRRAFFPELTDDEQCTLWATLQGKVERNVGVTAEQRALWDKFKRHRQRIEVVPASVTKGAA